MGDQGEFRRRPQRPVGAVVGLMRGANAGVRIGRQVIELPDHARGFAGERRPRLDVEGRAGPAGARQIGGEILLVELDHRVGLGIGRIDAVVRHHLHQVDDLVPAVLVEPELQHIARRVAAGAEVAEHALGVGIGRRRLGQRRHQDFARHLPDAPFRIGDRLEHEVGAPRGGKIDRAIRSLERQRLRPDPVLARRHRREIIVALLVGVDAGGDRAPFGLGRDGDARHLLAGGRRDRSAEHRIGSLRGKWCGGDCRHRGDEKAGESRQRAGRFAGHGHVSLG